MRIFTISAMAGFLAVGAPAATAAEASDAAKPARQGGPLKPGRSAGIHAAQLPRTGLALVGASAIIAIVAVAAGTGSSSNNPQSNLQSVTTTTP
jgi:hypothetical protein